MTKFIFKFLTLLLLVVCMFASIVSVDFFVCGNQYLENYQASFIDKMDLLSSIDEPKIILVGNSNVAFGFDSSLLEKEMGMPVVNLGIHSSLGNMFQEDMIKGYVNEGDIIIVCHNSYSGGYELADPSLVWITIEKHKEYYSIIRPGNYPEMLCSYPLYALKCLCLKITGKGNLPEDSCYSRSSFNKYGDIVYRPQKELEKKYNLFYEGAVKVPKISDLCVKRINELNDYVLSQGAKLVIAGYPIADYEYTPEKDKYAVFEAELRGKLDCPVISHFSDYFFSTEYFYNTVLHLTDEGVQLRTMQTAKDLKDYLSAVTAQEECENR